MTVQSPRVAAYKATGWRLTDLLPDADEATIVGRLAELTEQVAAFERLRDSLHPEIDPQGLAALVDRYAALVESVYVLSGYSALRFGRHPRRRRPQPAQPAA